MMLVCGCPGDYPDWDGRDIDLGGQYVHELALPTPLHMPLAYTMYLQRQQQAVAQLQLTERWPGFVLTQTGLWRGRLLRLLEPAQSPSRHVQVLPRPFHLHGILHHGNVSTIRPSVRKAQMALLDSGRMPKELYLCHLTCPRCATERGGDRLLLLRRWIESPALKRRTDARRDGR